MTGELSQRCAFIVAAHSTLGGGLTGRTLAQNICTKGVANASRAGSSQCARRRPLVQVLLGRAWAVVPASAPVTSALTMPGRTVRLMAAKRFMPSVRGPRHGQTVRPSDRSLTRQGHSSVRRRSSSPSRPRHDASEVELDLALCVEAGDDRIPPVVAVISPYVR